MKVTICFDDTKVIVPCGGGGGDVNRPNGQDGNAKLRVSDVIESSIAKYKKATGKVCFILIFFTIRY